MSYIFITILTSTFYQNKSRVWTAASQQHKEDNQPLAFSLKAVVYPWKKWEYTEYIRYSVIQADNGLF